MGNRPVGRALDDGDRQHSSLTEREERAFSHRLANVGTPRIIDGACLRQDVRVSTRFWQAEPSTRSRYNSFAVVFFYIFATIGNVG